MPMVPSKVLSMSYCKYFLKSLYHIKRHTPIRQNSYTPSVVQPWIDQQLSVTALLHTIESETAILGVLSIGSLNSVFGITFNLQVREHLVPDNIFQKYVPSVLTGNCHARTHK